MLALFSLMHIWGVFIGLMKSHKTLDKLANWCMQVAHLKSPFGAFLTLKPPSNFGPVWAGHGLEFWHLTAVICYCPESWPWLQKSRPWHALVSTIGSIARRDLGTFRSDLCRTFSHQSSNFKNIFSMNFSSNLIHSSSTYRKHENI